MKDFFNRINIFSCKKIDYQMVEMMGDNDLWDIEGGEQEKGQSGMMNMFMIWRIRFMLVILALVLPSKVFYVPGTLQRTAVMLGEFLCFSGRLQNP